MFRFLLLCLLIAAGLADLCAQTPLAERSMRKGSLYRIPGGYLEVVREGTLTQLVRYDDTLGFQSAAAAPVFGLNPIDLIVPTPPLPADRAYLLAAPFGRASLFAITLNTTPSITPVWESTLPPLRRVVALGDLDAVGSGGEAALIGDSAFVVIGLDGTERYTIRGDFIDAVYVRGRPGRFILAESGGSTIRLRVIDAATGRAVSSPKSIAGGDDVLMLLAERAEGDVLAIASSGTPPTACILDPATLSLLHDPIILPSMPVALVPVRDDESVHVAAIFSSYPSPSLLMLQGGATQKPIDYPLQGVVQDALASRNLIALLADDSVAFFDREMRPITTAPSPGVRDASLHELDSTNVLLSTATGARIYAVDTAGYSWLSRNWLMVIVVAGLLLVAVAAIAAARRYRFVRTIYNNLVRVRNSQGVIVMSQAQRVRHVNMSARAMLEIAPYIPLGRHISEYLVGDDTRALLIALRSLFAEGEEFEIRVDVEREGEPRALTFRGRPMIGQYGFTAGYLLLVSDITQTLERERLVNWASVAHHIAHEMKTPLGTVTMTAEMLHERLGANGHAGGEHLRATSRIIKQTERLRQIVEDLLTVARTESLQRQPADVSLIVSSLAHDYADILPRSVELRLELTGQNFRALVDVGQLTVALRNLLDNAWQAIGSRDGGLLVFAVAESDREITITVQDNGRGMNQTTLAKLFQPFYTEREGGSGIGTVIVKRVIEGHGGTVEVKSEAGRGTTFVLVLPR